MPRINKNVLLHKNYHALRIVKKVSEQADNLQALKEIANATFILTANNEVLFIESFHELKDAMKERSLRLKANDFKLDKMLYQSVKSRYDVSPRNIIAIDSNNGFHPSYILEVVLA